MPVLFVGHGNPMNAIEHNEFRANWTVLGNTLARPKAILCVSAHWETRDAYATATDAPETIHDFYGFPRALFEVRYPAPGEPALARRVAELVASERVRLDPRRGLDHGAWSVLVAMYPEADVPVVQLSMDTSRPGRHHYELARQLAPLRDEGVLVMGSGNIVHNLRQFDFRDPTPLAWASRCDAEIRAHVAAGRHDALMVYPTHDEGRLAVPTPEHYLPLLYAIALQQPGERAEFFNARVQGSISMTSVLIGGPAEA
ncbi:MAG TPA: 4,5-DOPA dioxygenase extradiol [Steroidobacteraceae bacterium]|jgi:4,5-DOPA dioxygenase extradiol